MSNAWKLGPEAASLLDKTGQVSERVIGPAATAVDKEARFPKEGIDALRAAGLLEVVSGKDAGGHGLGLRAAARSQSASRASALRRR